jgi:hypothetical protein
MSKCTRCQKDFTPLIKNDGLLYKTCDRYRSTDKKYKDNHKEQIKEYRDQYYLDNQDKIKEYRENNKDKIKEKAKEYREANKDKIYAKNKLNRITCECGCTSRRDKLSQHKKSSCHQKLMEEKNKLKRNLTDEELDLFFRTNYPFQFYFIPKDILITSYSQTI